MSPSRRAPWFLKAVCVFALLVVTACAKPTTSGSTKLPHLPMGQGIYASKVLDSDGHLDVGRTLDRVQAVHADRYYYLVLDSPAGSAGGVRGSWGDLPQFLRAARRRGIDVIVYLVPPSEVNGDYPPFHFDYVRWARAVAGLAASYPNLTGLAIDDLGANVSRPYWGKTGVFTSSVLSQVHAVLHERRPVSLLGVLYGQDFNGATAILGDIRQFLDGVIYVFAGPGQVDHQPQNSTDPNGLVASVSTVTRATGCDGASQCWQMRSAPGSPVADRSGTVDLGPPASGIRGDVTFWVTTDAVGASAAMRLQVSVGTRTVSCAQTAESGGWAHMVCPLGGGLVTATSLRVTVLGMPAATTLTIARFAVAGVSNFHVARHGDLSNVTPLPVILMLYAAPLGGDVTTPGAGGPGYVQSLLQQAETLVHDRSIDGMVIYKLNLTTHVGGDSIGDPSDFPLVQELYGRMA